MLSHRPVDRMRGTTALAVTHLLSLGISLAIDLAAAGSTFDSLAVRRGSPRFASQVTAGSMLLASLGANRGSNLPPMTQPLKVYINAVARPETMHNGLPASELQSMSTCCHVPLIIEAAVLLTWKPSGRL